MKIFGFEIRKAVPAKVVPPPVPAPSRWEGESERAFRKRQEKFVMDREVRKL